VSRVASGSVMQQFFVRLEEETLSEEGIELRKLLNRKCSVRCFPGDAYRVISAKLSSDDASERKAAEQVSDILEKATGTNLESFAMDDINGGGPDDPAQFAS